MKYTCMHDVKNDPSVNPPLSIWADFDMYPNMSALAELHWYSAYYAGYSACVQEFENHVSDTTKE